jgi:hypothetical protein
MSEYPAPTMYAPTLVEYERVAGLVAVDLMNGLTEEIVQRSLAESGWRGPGDEIPQIAFVIEQARSVKQKIEASLEEQRREKLRAQHAVELRAKEDADELAANQRYEAQQAEAQRQANLTAQQRQAEQEARLKVQQEQKRLAELQHREAAESAVQQKREEKRVRDSVISLASSRTGLPTGEFSIINELERDMLAFQKRIIMKLPPQDLTKVQTDVAGLLEQVKVTEGRDEEKKERARYEDNGTSGLLVENTTKVYFTYPEDKFPEVAQLFHKYHRSLDVRPKPPAGPNTKAALGLSPDQGGIVGKLTIKPPSDPGVAMHLSYLMECDIFSGGVEEDHNNTKAVMGLLLIHRYEQSKPYGPKWETEQDKIEMYEKHGLQHLLVLIENLVQ